MSASTKTIITGPPQTWPQGSQPPSRREINDLIQDPLQWSLYVQAFAKLAEAVQTKSVSWFQVAGIHGLPAVRWEGSGPTQSAGSWTGYCTHGMVLFPTWHRPYVSLVEQLINQYAVQIAGNASDEWKTAAANLRQPYWDWAANAVPPPEIIEYTTLDIQMPNGQTSTIQNPLYNYTFHPMDPSFGLPYTNWPSTLRNPTSEDADATDDVDGLRDNLSGSQANITTSTYNLFARVRTWNAFSNHTAGDGGSSSTSLEGIHDNIHGLVGNGGEMGDPSVAAFDPIFMLHHCNVDRMLALWQAVHPNTWVSSNRSEQGGTWTITPSQKVDTTTQLTPFWSADASAVYWNSTAARDWTQLGYSYPEFEGLDLSNQAAVQQAISAKINELYGGGASVQYLATVAHAPIANVMQAFVKPKSSPSQTTPSEAGVIQSGVQKAQAAFEGAVSQANQLVFGKDHDRIDSGFHAEGSGNKPAHNPGNPHQSNPGGSQPAAESNEGFYEWTARVQVEKFALGGSFAVCLFLVPDGASVPANARQWHTSPYFAGQHYIFANSRMGSCSNCQDQAENSCVNEGFVPITPAIIQQSGLHTTEPSAVAPYLKKHLVWKVCKMNKEIVPAQTIPSLEVVVVASHVTRPVDSHGHPAFPGNGGLDNLFPHYGTPHEHRDITAGRPGGAKSQDAA